MRPYTLSLGKPWTQYVERLTDPGPRDYSASLVILLREIGQAPAQVRPTKPRCLSTLQSIVGNQHQRRQHKIQTLRCTCRSWLACDGLRSSPNTGDTLSTLSAHIAAISLRDQIALVKLATGALEQMGQKMGQTIAFDSLRTFAMTSSAPMRSSAARAAHRG